MIRNEREDLNWDDLRIIAAVARTGSFARAGRALGLDETTVSRRLVRVETALGAPVFEAADGQRRPTAACRSILDELAGIEHRIDEVRRRVRLQGSAQRRIRLSTIGAIGEYLIAPNLDALLAEEPNLSLSLDTSDQNVDMTRWETDLAIRLGRPERGAFTMRRIGRMNFFLVRPKSIAIESSTVAAYPELLEGAPEMRALAKVTDELQVRLRTSNLSAIAAMVAGGRTVTVLPDFMVNRLREGVGIREKLSFLDLRTSREVWLLVQPHLRTDRVVRRVANWCAGLFGPEA